MELIPLNKDEGKVQGVVPWENEIDPTFRPSEMRAAWISPAGVSLKLAFELALLEVETRRREKNMSGS
jgi:hypothetical protein